MTEKQFPSWFGPVSFSSIKRNLGPSFQSRFRILELEPSNLRLMSLTVFCFHFCFVFSKSTEISSWFGLELSTVTWNCEFERKIGKSLKVQLLRGVKNRKAVRSFASVASGRNYFYIVFVLWRQRYKFYLFCIMTKNQKLFDILESA